MVHKVNDVKEIAYLPNVLLKILKKDIIIKEKKVKDQIRKNYLPEEAPEEYTNHLIFLKELSRLRKFNFPLKVYMNGYFLSLEEHFLKAFLTVSFFLRPRRKYTGKKTRRNSVNENSSKFRRNASPQGRWENYAKRRQSQTYT